MYVGAVGNDVAVGNGRLLRVTIPIKTSALRNAQLIQNTLVGHRSPSECEIDRNKLRLIVVIINFPMQHAGIDCKNSQRFQTKRSLLESRSVRRQVDLTRLVGNQNAGWISNRAMEIPIAEAQHHCG